MASRNYLFVCSQNRLRSPTAEQVFADRSDISVLSAGINEGAENPLTGELVEWADTIFAMERMHRTKIRRKFRRALKDTRIVVLDIPDDYAFMEPKLVHLLESKMGRWLPG